MVSEDGHPKSESRFGACRLRKCSGQGTGHNVFKCRKCCLHVGIVTLLLHRKVHPLEVGDKGMNGVMTGIT